MTAVLHRVESVHFARGWNTNDPAPGVCRCGWSGELAPALDEHIRNPDGGPVDPRMNAYGTLCPLGHVRTVSNGSGRYICSECLRRRRGREPL